MPSEQLPLKDQQKWCQQSTIYKRNKSLYRLQTLIGRGNFSVVHCGCHELTKGRFVFKQTQR